MSLPTSIRYIILGALIIWSNMANACFIQMVSEEIICNGSSVTLSPIVSPAGELFLEYRRDYSNHHGFSRFFNKLYSDLYQWTLCGK